MVRAPMGTCFSALKEWFPGTHNYSYDQQELADHFRRYRALMSQWRALYPNRILDVRYDELVADPDAVMREVLPFLGLPMHEGMGAIEQRTDIVASAGALRIGEPVRDEFQQQWRRYEPYLAPLKERLGALAY